MSNELNTQSWRRPCARAATRPLRAGNACATRSPTRPSAQDLIDVAYERHETPLGTIIVGATREGLVRVGLPSEREDDVLRHLAERISPRVLRASRASLVQTRRELDEYFGHERRLRHPPRLAARERLPPRGAARHGADPVRPHGLLSRRRDERGEPERGARGRHGARDQPAADRRPLPSRAAHRRRPRPVPRRPRGQGAAPPASKAPRSTSAAVTVRRESRVRNGV